MEKKRKYEFREEKNWKKVKMVILVVCIIAVVGIMIGLSLSKLSISSVKENSTMNATGNGEFPVLMEGKTFGKTYVYNTYNRDKNTIKTTLYNNSKVVVHSRYIDKKGYEWYYVKYTKNKKSNLGYIRGKNIKFTSNCNQSSTTSNTSNSRCSGVYYGEYKEEGNGFTYDLKYQYTLNNDGTFSADFGVSGTTGTYVINDNTISLTRKKEILGPRDYPYYSTSDYVIADDCSYIIINDDRIVNGDDYNINFKLYRK